MRLHNPKTVVVVECEDSQLVVRSYLSRDERKNRPFCGVGTNNVARHRSKEIDHFWPVKGMTPPVFEKTFVVRALFPISRFAFLRFALARWQYKRLDLCERLSIRAGFQH